MDKEFELIAHPQIHAFSAILVRLFPVRRTHTGRWKSGLFSTEMWNLQ